MNTSSDSLLLGDGRFPINFRPSRHYTERVGFVASLIGNTILVFLIRMEKNPVMIPYSRVLLMNVVFDYIYTFFSMLVEIELEMNSGAYIFVVNGFPKHLSVGCQKALVALWMVSIAATCHVAPVEFVFRYLRVVHSYTMTYKWLAVSAGIVMLCSINNGAWLYLAIDSVEDHNAAFGYLMSDPIWLEGGRRVAFYAAELSNTYFRLMLVSISIQDFSIVAIMTFSTLATLRKLAADRDIMSAKVRYMQSQLNKLMFAEFSSLTSVFVIPIGTAMIFLFLRVQWVGFGVVIAILLEWVPAVNPLTTIFLVGPYRRQLASLVKQRVLGKVIQPSSVHPSDAGHTAKPEASTVALP